tara:strand:+ start:2134 stop:2652 length:519 start_codon:yes stop_codon:yes gene_type:complete
MENKYINYLKVDGRINDNNRKVIQAAFKSAYDEGEYEFKFNEHLYKRKRDILQRLKNQMGKSRATVDRWAKISGAEYETVRDGSKAYIRYIGPMDIKERQDIKHSSKIQAMAKILVDVAQVTETIQEINDFMIVLDNWEEHQHITALSEMVYASLMDIGNYADRLALEKYVQ